MARSTVLTIHFENAFLFWICLFYISFCWKRQWMTCYLFIFYVPLMASVMYLFTHLFSRLKSASLFYTHHADAVLYLWSSFYFYKNLKRYWEAKWHCRATQNVSKSTGLSKRSCFKMQYCFWNCASYLKPRLHHLEVTVAGFLWDDYWYYILLPKYVQPVKPRKRGGL